MKLFVLSLAIFLFISCGEASENHLTSNNTTTENNLIDLKEENRSTNEEEYKPVEKRVEVDTALDEKFHNDKDISEHVHTKLSNEKKASSNKETKVDNTYNEIEKDANQFNEEDINLKSEKETTEQERSPNKSEFLEEIESKSQSSNLHDDFDTFLKKHVSDGGVVNYKAIKKKCNRIG